jgi:hypothetical protein
VHCGAGGDTVVADAVGVDAVGAECGRVSRAPRSAFAAQIRSSTIRLRGTRSRASARVIVVCPASAAAGCRGRLTLTTRSAVRVGGVRAVLELGRANLALVAGQRRTVSVRMASGFARLARRGSIRARATVATQAASATRALTLRLPRR